MYFALTIGVFALFILGLSFSSSRQAKEDDERAGLLARATPRKVVEVGQDGALVCLSGVAICDEPLSALPDGADAIYYHVRLQREVESDDGPSYRTVHGERRATGFWLDDGAGRAWVDANHSQWSPVRELRPIGDGDVWQSYPERVRPYLEQHGATVRRGRIEGPKVYLRACAVAPGEEVTVIGRPTFDDRTFSSPSGYRGESRPAPVLSGQTIELVADAPRDALIERLRQHADGQRLTTRIIRAVALLMLAGVGLYLWIAFA